jgi:hypothetical protein
MPTANKQRAHEFKRGDRLSARWAQKVENFITSFRVLSGGHFVFDGRNAVLQVFGRATFTGVMLAGKLYATTEDLPGSFAYIEPPGEGHTHLNIDMQNLTVAYGEVSTLWYVESIPISVLSGLIVIPLVPHYVEPQ